MSLNVDTSQSMRRPSDLEALVRAVLNAVAQDEAEWIEWKSTLPLDSPEGWFSISKQILGMANRNTDRAARFAGGLGYIIIGAEPGQLHGVRPVDVAQFDAYLQRYLGTNGPVWAPTYLTIDHKTVLVVVVEAPQEGDPIHLLHKTYQPTKGQGADAGTVFVRGQADTARANLAEMQMLQARLLGGAAKAAKLELQLGWLGEPVTPVPVDPNPAIAQEWLDRRREVLLEPLAAAQKSRTERAAPGSAATASALGLPNSSLNSLRAVMGAFGETEKRTPDAYRGEVEAYLAEATKQLHPALVSSLVDTKVNLMTWVVTNPTDLNFPNVEVVVHIPGRVTAYDDNFSVQLPNPPWPYGKFRQNLGLLGSNSYLYSAGLGLGLQQYAPSRMQIENGGSVMLTFSVGSLRPRETVELDTFSLITLEPPGTQLTASWTTTSTGINGVHEGTFTITVGDRAVSVLDAVPITDDDEDERP